MDNDDFDIDAINREANCDDIYKTLEGRVRMLGEELWPSTGPTDEDLEVLLGFVKAELARAKKEH
jgi:hypothetical protein